MTWTKWLALAVVTALLTACGESETERRDERPSPAAGSPDTGPSEIGSGESPAAAETQPPGTDTPPADGTHLRPPADPPSRVSAEDAFRDRVLELTSNDLPIRERALDALNQMDDALPRCVELLGGSPPQVRQGAAFFLLGKFGAGSAEADGALIAALTDEDAGVRHIALQAVNELQGDDVLPAIGQLARMLENDQEDKHIRAQIARRFGRMGPEAEEIVPTLKQLGLADPDRDVRASCLYALYKIADRDEAVAVFREVLREDADMGLRGVAATRLGSFGAAAASSVPDLVMALDKNKDPAIRGKAAEALARIGKPALPSLIERFEAPDREIRILAIFSVGRMGPTAASAAPQLQQLLDHPDRDVRLAAELSLRRLQGGP